MGVLLPTPEYLHKQKAFGIWSLPDRSTAFRTCVEEYLDAYIDFYKKIRYKNFRYLKKEIDYCNQQLEETRNHLEIFEREIRDNRKKKDAVR